MCRRSHVIIGAGSGRGLTYGGGPPCHLHPVHSALAYEYIVGRLDRASMSTVRTDPALLHSPTLIHNAESLTLAGRPALHPTRQRDFASVAAMVAASLSGTL